MSNIQQLILGTYPNDGTGDDLRTAFVKTQANINALNTDKVENGQNLGTDAPVFLDKNGATLRFRSIKSANSNLSVSYDSENITLSVVDLVTKLEDDSAPKLGGILDVNGYNIVGIGDIVLDGNIEAFSFTGDVIGDVVGNLLGNVSGQISDISNHNLSSLGDVDSATPATGQALVWNGSAWTPGTVSGGGGGGGDLDFGTFTSPSGFTLDLGSF